jgi:hypothetical protein
MRRSSFCRIPREQPVLNLTWACYIPKCCLGTLQPAVPTHLISKLARQLPPMTVRCITLPLKMGRKHPLCVALASASSGNRCSRQRVCPLPVSVRGGVVLDVMRALWHQVSAKVT